MSPVADVDSRVADMAPNSYWCGAEGGKEASSELALGSEFERD